MGGLDWNFKDETSKDKWVVKSIKLLSHLKFNGVRIGIIIGDRLYKRLALVNYLKEELRPMS